MKDTSADVQAAVTALFAARSGSDRVRMACEMFDAAKALVAADIRSRRPDIGPADLRVQIFERLYGDNFDEAMRARIVARLAAE